MRAMAAVGDAAAADEDLAGTHKDALERNVELLQ